MANTLNQRQDSLIAQDLESILRGIERWSNHPVPEDIEDRHAFLWRLTRLHLRAGLVYTQQRQFEEARRLFSLAAAHTLNFYDNLQSPDPGANPIAFVRDMALVVCFASDRSLRARAARIEPYKYNLPEGTYGHIQSLNDALQSVLGTGDCDRSALSAALEKMLGRDGTKRDVEMFAPVAGGLLGVLEGDEARMNQGIADHLRWHERESMRGEWKAQLDAFVDLRSLLLVQLGRERGLACTVASRYLPLELLEGTAP